MSNLSFLWRVNSRLSDQDRLNAQEIILLTHFATLVLVARVIKGPLQSRVRKLERSFLQEDLGEFGGSIRDVNLATVKGDM